MHRFRVLLLACLGALMLPHREGRADPNMGSKPANREGSEPAPPAAAVKREPKGPPKADAEAASKKPAGSTNVLAPRSKGPPAWARKSEQSGVVRLVRGSETLEIRVLDRRQHLVPATLPHLARFLRSRGGADHPVDGRLVTLLALVSDHFGGREVTVVSGFRPYSPGQYSRHSNHNEGRAIDFSIRGVANETVRDFCRTFRNVGVGYYPNSLFVHLDVREGNAYWVDYAAPGQAPRYRQPDTKGDDDDGVDEGDAIASVDAGSGPKARPIDGPRMDVTSGRNRSSTSGSSRDSTDRGVFVNH